MARRLFLFAVLVAALVAAAVWFADRPGSVTIHWQGWRIDTSVPVLLTAMISFMAALAFVWRLLTTVVGAPGR
ncbi:MAG: heme biosynthesis HemY N-terminal domain-containing protein, partial [Magnetospirillum sp.]